MKRMLAARLTALALALTLSGCITLYEPIAKPAYTPPDGSYTVTLPTDWLKLGYYHDRLAITHDGELLERITISRVPAVRAFPFTKMAASDKLLPSELADLQFAEIQTTNPRQRSADAAPSYKMIASAPATVGGNDNGFRLQVRIQTTKGLVGDELVYGVVNKGYYYVLAYRAPNLHYFEKYRPAFEEIVQSFRLN
jgi:hypothetical protein